MSLINLLDSDQKYRFHLYMSLLLFKMFLYNLIVQEAIMAFIELLVFCIFMVSIKPIPSLIHNH